MSNATDWPCVHAAMRDASVTVDERGLMPLEEARRVSASIVTFERGGPDDDEPFVTTDLAWAALLSLADAAEFLKYALVIRWNFHVRGRDNLGPFERYGESILPWIAQAVDDAGQLRNVPWCLAPCLLAIGTIDALRLALRVVSINESLDPSAAPGPIAFAKAWTHTDPTQRLPLLVEQAKGDLGARELLSTVVSELGHAAIDTLRASYEDPETVLLSLKVELPRADAEIEAQLSGLPVSSVPSGPPWTVRELDRDEFFPYWQVLAGYETPYAVRVSAFASEAGDVLFVQRVVRDERGSDPGTCYVVAYGPGAVEVDRSSAVRRLISEEDVASVELPNQDGQVDGLSEVAHTWRDADEHGIAIADSYEPREARNPMPHRGVLLKIAGTGDDLELPWQLPRAWQDVASSVAGGDASLADKMLRSIDPAEGLLLRLCTDYRERMLFDERALREMASLPTSAELLFQIDDPPLPMVWEQRMPSGTAPWPLICEALRRRVRLDVTHVPTIDVLRMRLAWSEQRGGGDVWGAEVRHCEPSHGFTEELLSRGWPHGVRLLHQHPHNQTPEAVFDWLIAQPELPLRSYWAREVAERFLRHVGGDLNARTKSGWIYPKEARRIVHHILTQTTSLSALGSEHVTLLLEAFVGAPTLLDIVHAELDAMSDEQHSAPNDAGFHAVFAIGWVLRRAISEDSDRARERLMALSKSIAIDTDLGRALDLAIGGLEAAQRSARTPSEWLLANDVTAIAKALAHGPLPLDLQVYVSLGDAAFARWESQPMSDSEKVWFASELEGLDSLAARALATKLRTT
jgi:hypothetical protein